MNTTGNTRRFIRTAIVTALAIGAVAAIPATGSAATTFGANLGPNVQPSNSNPAKPCTHQDPGKACTRVEIVAFANPGHAQAPRNGLIKKIKVIAGGKGSFRLQIAHVKVSSINGQNEAKVVRRGPKIHYQGQSAQNWNSDNYKVEAFKVHVRVRKGQFLAFRSKFTSALRCDSGGTNQFIFEPPLLAGGGLEPASTTDGCFMLVQAVMK